MVAAEQYDDTLTGRIRDGAAAMEATPESSRETMREALERVERRIQSLLPTLEVDRVLSLLHPAASPGGSTADRVGPVRGTEPMSRSASEMLTLSRQLDEVQDPTQALTIGEHVARRAHELARTLDRMLSVLDSGELLSQSLHALLAYASQLIRNAIARIRQFAAALGVTSVAITLSTLPPEFSITFTF
ncbi:MAG: hypothetical protein L3K07_07235 [Thermoplasmata archaeon]|nr:hypothetical protein [Thermoplasmata archaeon]